MGSSLSHNVPVVQYTGTMLAYADIPGFTGFILFLAWMLENAGHGNRLEGLDPGF